MLDEINRQLDLYAFARILESPDRKAEKDWLIENGRLLQKCGQKLLLRNDAGGSYLIHFLTRAAVQHAKIHGPPLEIGIDQAIDHNNAKHCVDNVINSIILFSKWCHLIENDLEGEDWMTDLLVGMQPEVRLIGDHLPAIYEKYLGKRFGASISAGGKGPGGPGLRFVVGVLNHADIKNQNGQPYSVHTLKKYVHDVRKETKRRK